MEIWTWWLIIAGICFVLEIATEGFLMCWFGVGALASVLIVLFVLPSLLLVTEKAIDKTDFNKLFKRKVK